MLSVNSTARICLPTKVLLQPHIEDHVNYNCPAWSFLIENEMTGKKVLFDLGVPKDWQNALAPAPSKRIQGMGWTCDVKNSVADVLTDNGWDLKDINAIIWSHQHWDQYGFL